MVLSIVWIAIFSLTSSVFSDGIFTYNETNPLDTPPQMWQDVEYLDGTVIIRIINSNSNKTGVSEKMWTRPVLSLRIIHPNGTVSEIDKDLEIQEFNWLIIKSPNSIQDPISIHALQRGYLLVRYFNASNPENITTYEEWGRIIDWNGKLYEEVYLGGVFIENNIWYPSVTSIVSNVDPAKGFIRLAGRNSTFVEWQQYMIGDSFNLKKLQEGNITFPQKDINTILDFMATADEGYSIIIGNSINSTNSNNILEIYAEVYYLRIGYNETQFSTPKLLYQSSLPNITISNLICGISSSGIGHVCTLTVIQNNVINSTNYFVKLDFLISGSVTKITPINNLPELPPSNDTTGWLIKSIPYGGYLFYAYFVDADDHISAYGYYFNEIENNFEKWDFPEPSVLNLMGILIILPNNTLLLSQMESNNTWSLNTTNIPNYSGNSDNGYSNLLIDSTSPSINANISNISTLTDMGNITITYYEPVEPSDGNIWIYRIDDSKDNNITRQFVNSNNNKFCFISNNGLTVTVKVIISTFSYPNSQFYVKIDNNFVKSKKYDEPLMGINDNIWKFNTIPSTETFAGTVSGVLRLTMEGTQHYENLNLTEKDDFFFDLRTELSKIIPVDFDRLKINAQTQVDTTISPNRQIFISLDIQSSRSERSVQSIINDLKFMIKYKSITSICLFPTTNYLDEEFGFEPRQNLWVKYKIKLMGVIISFGILLGLFLIAKIMNNKGRNTAILQLGLIIFDFVMDVLFVSKNGDVVEVLYNPSIIFLTVPIVTNTILAFYIIFEENKSKTFLSWFTQHGKVASIFTVLSGADIETLSILHSNMAGFEIFNAPFSTEGKSRIFWGSCLNILLEDLPQVIIQILYQQSVIIYDIIPLLALVSSCLSLLVSIVGKLFQAINICRHRYERTRNEDDFGGLQPFRTPDT
ncbi:hypothetical protein Glove_707g9 [Diversispora epigaea]|uniref:Uncharacterized protein n=1 Tax=Diversispora epigaea TaxID=1348612 RepID=A0A397G1M6_9GLOM|nr:hypothetical protein Glove_707g9 [Diversispora epigaea]